jgi:anaphase-promoting complex subunit 8
LKRALAVAARDETGIKLKLAGVYDTLEDLPSAVTYHLQYIETCERLGKGISEYARSCIFVAKHFSSVASLSEVEMAIGLLKKVASSNAEENQLAKDALPKLEGVKRQLLKPAEV